jgi:hypothetical protein
VSFVIRCNDFDPSTLLLTMSIFCFKFVVIIYYNYILCDCQLFSEINVSRPLSIKNLKFVWDVRRNSVWSGCDFNSCTQSHEIFEWANRLLSPGWPLCLKWMRSLELTVSKDAICADVRNVYVCVHAFRLQAATFETRLWRRNVTRISILKMTTTLSPLPV